jgi:putative ABC transport system permease protein
MMDSLYLAWRYLCYQRFKTLILVASIALILFVPAGLQVLFRQGQRELSARARSTPLIIGARGSRLELVLNALYFETNAAPPLSMAEVDRLRATDLAVPIPLHTRFRARAFPIVGTTLEYFSLRHISPIRGRQIAMLGECVVGSSVADDLDIGPGGSIVSTPENPFDLAGVYPLKMNVVGVLPSTGTADDRAVFVDVKTTWIIAGLGHGHQDLVRPDAASQILDKSDSGGITANASVVQYTEITARNAASFHFHGAPADFPINAIIAVPNDAKSSTLLRGRYLSPTDVAQIVVPSEVMLDLLGTILTVRSLIIAASSIVAVAALLTTALVFILSLRLRQREIRTMHRLGCSRQTIASIVAAEIVVVFLAACLLAAALTVVTSQLGANVVRWFVL